MEHTLRLITLLGRCSCDLCKKQLEKLEEKYEKSKKPIKD